MSLYPYLFERVLFGALDVFNGTEVSRCYRDLLRTQWLSFDELAARQERKLDAMLRWTDASSPFYRQLWDRAPQQARAASSYPALDGVPLVTKADLRAAGSEFPLQAYGGHVYKVHTSGSTGEPMVFYRSREQESWFWALRLRMWQWGGYRAGEPYLTLNLNPRLAWKKRLQDVLFRCSYHGFNANEHDVEAVIADLTKHRVKHLVGYASSLFLLSRAMRQKGIPNPGVQTILSTGDTLLPSYREIIEDVFGVEVCDYYGAGGEGVHIASQCERRDAYHVHIENTVVEVLKDGRPARPGEMGEIVVTQLENHAMPLIRYATQDLATVSSKAECGCGRALPLLDGIQGRVPDIVFAPDGSCLVVHFFTILFEYMPEVLQFQIVQESIERIVARIVRGEAFEAARFESQVRAAIARATSGSLEVDFDYVPTIPLSPSLKRRFVISDVMSSPYAIATAPVPRPGSATPQSHFDSRGSAGIR